VNAHLAELLSTAAAEAPDQVALVESGTGRRVTWAELDAEVGQVACGLDALGLVAGYRVVMALTNRVEWVAAYLGALRAGLVVVPVNPRSATGELVRMLADCGARVVFADETSVTTVRQAVAGLQDALTGADEELRTRTPVPRVLAVSVPTTPGETSYDELLGARGDPPPTSGDPERLAVLLYTSGASGRPRAAMLSHRALLANIEQNAAVDPPVLTGADVVLGVLPLFHVYGLNAVLGQVLRQQARLVLVDAFDGLPEQGTLAVVAEQAVTVLPVAPPVFGHWQHVPDLRERLSSVRLVLSGSAPLPPGTVADFTERTGLDVHQGYGLTEAAPVVTSTLCSVRLKPGSVGAALPGVEVGLVDDHGRAPEGEDAGEIRVRGDNLFSGWWPDGEDAPDPEVDGGWYATGDVGFLDEEGDLFLVDRLKDLVIVSGFNVYPTEVEEVVAEVEGVAEAAVIGVPDPDTGEAVVAYVRLAPSFSDPDGRADPLELVLRVQDHCATRLARFKRPAEVHVVDRLPHTVTGKVAKGRLRAERRDPGLLQ
jgi:long-chain acyl-CoA synthetase